MNSSNFLSDTIGRFFEFLHSGIFAVVQNPNVSYGLTIILLTLIIRIILLPLNIKQMRSTIRMGKIQPELKKLQDRYKNDPQKLQTEMMKLYKDNGANPLSGCLPMLIQMPILFALFYVFNNLTFMTGTMTEPAGFLWVKNLAMPDPYYLFPILSAATTFISSKMMQPAGGADNPQAKQTSNMNTMMAVFFGIMSIRFKAGLVVYWVTNNLIQMGQTILIRNIEEKREAKA